jgi:predicted nicotinamide N-methyase
LPDRAARAAFIVRNLQARMLPEFGGLTLYLAHPGSGLSRLGARPPYWAHVWAGGAVLAAHVLQNPDLVRGRRVLDFGAGSGLLALVAARAGARALVAETDPWARAALAANASANGVRPGFWRGGRVDLVLAGDVFYAPEVAAKVLPVLEDCLARGAQVLVGDPGRRDLPLHRLAPLAERPVRDMGDPPGVLRPARVFALRPV